MADYDVIVIGGGPAGYAAALKAAELGATVAMVEAEKPGGACVHHACIPTQILLDAALSHVRARELGALGVFDAGEQFNFGRAAARKDVLVRQLGDGIQTALRMRGVALIAGRAAFTSPHTVGVLGPNGTHQLSGEAFIIATGTRWQPPEIPGLAPERLVTPDVVQSLTAVPRSVLVLGGGPCDVDFGLEYAALLAIAGAKVTFATQQQRLLPALDASLVPVVQAALADLGIDVLEGMTGLRGTTDGVEVAIGGAPRTVEAEVILATDVRRPFVGALGLEFAGVHANGGVEVDRSCRTNLGHIYAAGDVTGQVMLSSAASHMGEVAAINATGGSAVTRLTHLPRVVHGVSEIALVGASEEAARAAGRDVATGSFDLSFNARALAMGARTGVVKVIAGRELGGILGVHAVGPEAGAIVAVAAGLMQAEATVHDLAAITAWHPSVAEGLVEAARRACAAI